MSKFRGGGLKVGNVIYGVTRLLHMKRVQLYREEGTTITFVAGFRNEQDATAFVEWLTLIADVHAAR